MKPDNVRGKNLDKKGFEEATRVKYDLNAEYAYDMGYAVSRYLMGLKEGKIVGIKCHKCGRILVPPRAFCEQCYVPIDDFVELSGRGKVNTFSISYVKWDASRIEKPEIPAVIELEGASAGVGILHVLGEVDPKDVHVGMEVEAVFKEEKDRKGEITDILYFRPVK
jgi:uncharacterized OB-fold protein